MASEPVPASHAQRIAMGLRHEDPAVRQAAAVTLGRLHSAATPHLEQLAGALVDDPQASVRRAAAAALGSLGKSASSKATALLATSLRDTDEEVRFAAAMALGALGEVASQQTQELAEALRSAGTGAREAAAEVLTSNRSRQSSAVGPLQAWKHYQQLGT